MVTTIVSTDGSPALEWQVELLAYSHELVGQPGDLVVLRDTVEVPGDCYPPYNKPYALARWLAGGGPATTEWVVVVDPDMVFLRPWAPRPAARRPLAHDSCYRADGRLARALARHTAAPGRLQGIAVPLSIHRCDLERLAPLWFSETVRLRGDAELRSLAPWVCEMWGCAVAAARLSLRFRIGVHAAVPPFSAMAVLPFIHYSFAVDGFDKRDYRPWESPPQAANAAYGRLRDVIDEYRLTVARSQAACPDGEQPSQASSSI